MQQTGVRINKNVWPEIACFSLHRGNHVHPAIQPLQQSAVGSVGDVAEAQRRVSSEKFLRFGLSEKHLLRIREKRFRFLEDDAGDRNVRAERNAREHQYFPNCLLLRAIQPWRLSAQPPLAFEEVLLVYQSKAAQSCVQLLPCRKLSRQRNHLSEDAVVDKTKLRIEGVAQSLDQHRKCGALAGVGKTRLFERRNFTEQRDGVGEIFSRIAVAVEKAGCCFGRELFGDGGAERATRTQLAKLVQARRSLAPADLQWGLNEGLPSDVNVLSVEPAPPTFHARRDAMGRTYLYRISRRRSAFHKRFVWWVRDRLDFAGMARAAPLWCGRHDFASFCENPEGQESTVVVVEQSTLVDRGDEIHYRIDASHFLWKMVRRLVGTLVEVGRGNLGTADVERLLRERSAEPAKWTAPPSGLFLEKVQY